MRDRAVYSVFNGGVLCGRAVYCLVWRCNVW